MIVRRLRSVSSAQELQIYVAAVVLAGAIVLADAAFDAVRAPRPIRWVPLSSAIQMPPWLA